MDLTNMGFIFFINAVAVVSLANLGFKIYTIVQAFKWLEDFVHLSGHRSKNWNWTVSILILAFIEVFGNGGVFKYVYERQKADCRRKLILGLFIISLLQLAITAPPWYAVGNCRWAELLREAGHYDHAYHVGVFYIFGTAAIIFWSIIGFICLIAVLCFVATEPLYRRSMRNLCKENDQRKDRPTQSKADPDKEDGNDQAVAKRPTSTPLTLNPIFPEGDCSN